MWWNLIFNRSNVYNFSNKILKIKYSKIAIVVKYSTIATHIYSFLIKVQKNKIFKIAIMLKNQIGDVTQLVEHYEYFLEARGSTPCMSN